MGEVVELFLWLGEEEVERLESILLPDEFRDFLETCCSFYAGHDATDELE